MRILFTADPELPVPPDLYGGIERLVDLWLQAARRRNHVVALCAHPASTAAVDHFQAWPGPRSQHGPSAARNTWTLYRTARRFQADVVHSSSRLIYTLPLLLAGIPVVQTYHRFPGVRQIRLAAKLAHRHRLAFTGISDFITNMGRPGGGHWHTVHNCIDIDRLTFRPRVASDAPLVFLSRVEQVKGVREAIAIARAAGRVLLIAGNKCSDANATRYWQEEIEPLLDERTRYIGPVDDRAKDALLGSALGMLVPVQWDEPFGLVFAESLACGTPVIGTPRGGIPEIVRSGETGFLINTLSEGVAAVEKLAGLDRHRCRTEVEQRFSPTAAVDHFESVYRTILSS